MVAMMSEKSETPRTDAAHTGVIEDDGTISRVPWISVDFARQLERDLTAALTANAELTRKLAGVQQELTAAYDAIFPIVPEAQAGPGEPLYRLADKIRVMDEAFQSTTMANAELTRKLNEPPRIAESGDSSSWFYAAIDALVGVIRERNKAQDAGVKAERERDEAQAALRDAIAGIDATQWPRLQKALNYLSAIDASRGEK